jgi:hypothetical protein
MASSARSPAQQADRGFYSREQRGSTDLDAALADQPERKTRPAALLTFFALKDGD